MEAPAVAPRSESSVVLRAFLARLAFYLFVVVVSAFFTLPLLWLVLAPFDRHPTLAVKVPSGTLANFRDVFHDPFVITSLRNSAILAIATMAIVVSAAALAAYALSRVRVPGRDLLLYVLLLFSSIVTGSAAMVPLFLLVFDLGLINSYAGVVLVLAGGLLPAAIFILKDFMDTMPKSYEESARVFGANSFQVLGHVVLPNVRPGLATIAVWAVVNVWGNFLMPFLLYRTPEKQPAAVTLNNFYTEGGQPNLALISTFSLLYSIPVVIMFLFVSRRYGFRFHGGIKA
jgi:multiple sugar transport system permease protein